MMTPQHHLVSVISRPARLVVLGWFMAGMSLIVGAAFGFEVNPALRSTSVVMKVVLGLLLAVGSALVSFSTLRWRNKSTAWKLELTAYPLLIAAWALYTSAVFLTDGLTLFPLSLGIAFFAASMLRLIEVLKIIRQTRTNVADLEARSV